MDDGFSRRRVLGLAGVGTTLVATGLVGGVADAAGAESSGEPTAMGSIGVTRTQVARLSAVNYDGAVAAGGIAGGGCVVSLEIRRLSGELLASQRFQLAPGQGAYLDVLNLEGPGARQQIYGVVKHLVQPLDFVRPAHTMGATLEVFDAQTGETRALVLPAVQMVREAANRPG